MALNGSVSLKKISVIYEFQFHICCTQDDSSFTEKSILTVLGYIMHMELNIYILHLNVNYTLKLIGCFFLFHFSHVGFASRWPVNNNNKGISTSGLAHTHTPELHHHVLYINKAHTQPAGYSMHMARNAIYTGHRPQFIAWVVFFLMQLLVISKHNQAHTFA